MTGPMTTAPAAGDYYRAIQSPARAFTVSSLQAAEFVWDSLGPTLARGSSAVVFHATVDGTPQALRCYVRSGVSSRERYSRLNDYLDVHDLEPIVSRVTWIDAAIRVNGATWPVLQMGWIDGRTLNEYVDFLVTSSNTPALAMLATRWRDLVALLQGAGFAHGDLQHSNVMVDQEGQLRLVDYDTVWVPQLAGMSRPAESGHPNYQHPIRYVWGRWIDTFSALVIYLSLVALSKDPGLWLSLYNSKNLLFGKPDFYAPFGTQAWEQLAALRDPQVDELARRLRECCAPSWVPDRSLEMTLEPRWWEKKSVSPAPPPPASPVGAALPPTPPPPSAPRGAETGPMPQRSTTTPQDTTWWAAEAMRSAAPAPSAQSAPLPSAQSAPLPSAPPAPLPSAPSTLGPSAPPPGSAPRSSRPRLRLPRGGLPRLRLPRRGDRARQSGEATSVQGRDERISGGYATRPAGESRYANATISDARSGQRWSLNRVIQPKDLLLLRVDIGPPSSLSQVEEPVPFPDRELPAGDLVIDVVVTSTSFSVGPFTAGTGRPSIPAGHAHASQFVLPGDGGPARAADGGPGLAFVLAAPRSPGLARLRIIYYFRGAIVQSQLLTARIGAPVPKGGQATTWSLVTDYTITRYLPGIADITRRRRLSVVLNGDGAGHEIYVRTPGPVGGQPQTAAVSLPPAIGDAVRDLRKALAGESVAPTTVTQSRAQLITAMRTIAPLGWQLCAALFPGLQEVLYSLQAALAPVILHVARPAGVTLSVPWALLYTTSIDSRHGPGFQSVPICPLVSNWDGRAPLVSVGQTCCPYSGSVSHTADLLCPFGFLGYRHDIEQLNSADRPVVTITAPSGSHVVIAETAYQIDRKALQGHVTSLRQAFARLPGINVAEAASKDLLKQLICTDLPVIYFLCHGERPRAGSRETFLGIGNREHLTPADFIGWVQDAFLSRHIRVWDQVRPLIFINACHSAELDPAALFNYIDAFVGMGHAAGVIGTEVKVSQELAMEFARCFFDELLSPGITVGMAMRHARLAFLARGNLFGLDYTPYCWADLTVTP
jgi:eukaryotic-like serine/threonine-protein kinase